MSLGLLDDDNPWNDNQIPPITTPDTGHAHVVVATTPAVGQDSADEGADAAPNGTPNGYVAGAKRVASDAGPFELDASNGHALDAASRAADGWPPASTSSPPATNGTASRRPSATASTSSTSSPPSRLHRSTSNASSKSRPAGWTTPAPAALQRSASRASTSSGRRPSGGAADVKTGSAPTPSAPRLHRSSSSASSRGAAALVQTLGDAWASATSLHRASSTSSSTTASRPLFSTRHPHPPLRRRPNSADARARPAKARATRARRRSTSRTTPTHYPNRPRRPRLLHHPHRRALRILCLAQTPWRGLRCGMVLPSPRCAAQMACGRTIRFICVRSL